MNSYLLVTGANGGIGRLLCSELSKQNNLLLSGMPSEREELEVLRKSLGISNNHLIWTVDFASDRMLLFDSLNSFLQMNEIAVHSFVHCAGITQIIPFRNFTPDRVNKIFEINVFSAIEILRVLLKKDNHGALRNILFISALWSIRGNSGNSIYSASKGALNSLVLALTQELSPKVRVNSLLPGAIMTPMSENLDKSFLEKMNEETPLGIGKIEDVVNYACFLLSDKAKWITGQNIVVDGGRSTK